MNKTELIEAIATRSNTTKAQTTMMLNELIEVIQKTLADGDNVQLVGFGTFSITERAGREGRNPSTGESMTIPAKKVVKFKPGKTLSDAAAAKPASASNSNKTK
ncbi:HU family DNA-binding protein [Nitrosomonas ureae]|uniref:DNA-binding protein HU-beta n=1 Tax=Nitrosomonas ureae TaxID=44577 RepID=A0A1H9GCG4_9PROT|nr:HU family DNA-binding protein [Nitrosomonas ureae]PTQ85823.1 DNA-binding protein HU-beta [Nitrosomonas ureae]SEQ47784.1 DNA-binding protein HU-beta [Nitrosomonas ureae]